MASLEPPLALAGGERPLVVANWKMNKLLVDAVAYVHELGALLPPRPRSLDIAIAPTFVHLVPMAAVAGRYGLELAAQDCHSEADGPYTGEVSAPMVFDAGARSVVLGHSERRQHFGETDAVVAGKARAAIRAGLVPIVCVGETGREREAGLAAEVLKRQVTAVLDGIGGVEADALSPLVVAYEPVWAIGTGYHAAPGQVREAATIVRECIETTCGYGLACAARVLYGGSVSLGNVRSYVEAGGVDGALVGGASLEPKAFAALVEVVGRWCAGGTRLGPPRPPEQ